MKALMKSLLSAALVFCLAAFASAAHAAALSDYLENKLVDHLLRGQSYTPPATTYVALYTSACNDAVAGTEVSGGSYARAPVTSSASNWSGTQAAGSTTASNGTTGTVGNNGVITFAMPTASWGAVSYIGLVDAATGGNLLVCTALTTPKTNNSGDTVSFPAGSLTVQIDN